MALPLQADLEQMLQDARATAVFSDYLIAMRTLTPDVIALVSPDEAHLEHILLVNSCLQGTSVTRPFSEIQSTHGIFCK